MNQAALAIKIANACFDAETIIFDPEHPFIGASSIMPLYNDNRKLLSKLQTRQLVTDGFIQIIQQQKMQFDAIAGTSLSGIPHAASLAQRYNTPLVLLHNDNAYLAPQCTRNELFHKQSPEALASTAPLAMAEGVRMANDRGIGYLYVRRSKKEHGKGQRIEWDAKKQNVVLLDYHLGDSYVSSAKAALREKNIKILAVHSISAKLIPYHIKDKRILFVEDLVNTAKSVCQEIQQYKSLGAKITDCLTICDYTLITAKKQFANEACNQHSIITLEHLLTVAQERSQITQHQLQAIREWQTNPDAWSERRRTT